MIVVTKEVYSEVYDIIQHMEEEVLNQIPSNFIDMIRKKRDETFIVNIDYSKNINEQKLQKGTRVILSLIYRDYVCSKEERENLIKKDKENLKLIEEELREKYKIDIFENKRNKLDNNEKEQTAMVVHKETIIQKILKKFRDIF